MGTAARMAVGVVLLVAGAAKLGQPAWRATAATFGAPGWLAPVLPWVELSLGAALLVGLGRPWTAWGALALLAVFTVIVAQRLRRGDRVPCGCFGEASPAPVGLQTLARNLLLCLLALVAALGGGDGSPTVGPAVVGVGLGMAVVVQSRRPHPHLRG
ncbi:MAG: MauE/DoxX family redox-associated membrane protein [Acidimicrobiales bacterium]